MVAINILAHSKQTRAQTVTCQAKESFQPMEDLEKKLLPTAVKQRVTATANAVAATIFGSPQLAAFGGMMKSKPISY